MKLFSTTKVLLCSPSLTIELIVQLCYKPFVLIEVTFLVSPPVRTPNPKAGKNAYVYFTIALQLLNAT